MQPIPLLLEQLGDTGAHQQEIEAAFAGNVAWTGPERVIPHPLILIAFTNRCGSNYLAELMRLTGRVRGMGEGLNAETVLARCEKWGIEDFPGYFRALSERHEEPFGFKASWDQLLMLLRWRIHEMFSGVRIVHIHRRDVVGQAISREIAWQTGKWTSRTPVEESVTPTYDAQRITQQIAAIQREESLFPLIFDAFELSATKLAYEDLVARPGIILRAAMEEIGLPCPEWRPSKTRIQKQADETNDAFRAAYRDIVRGAALRSDRSQG